MTFWCAFGAFFCFLYAFDGEGDDFTQRQIGALALGALFVVVALVAWLKEGEGQ